MPIPYKYRLNTYQLVASSDHEDENESIAVVELDKPKLKKPPLYRVILLNDDYTPMEFVVSILMDFFSMTQDEAIQIMLHVHQKGVGVCGVFTREIAESKVEQVMQTAMDNQHPLQCSMEPDEDDE